jgi:RecB family exonuclease
MGTAAVANGVGELLSPSQVKTFLNCPAKWYFHYMVGLQEPKNGSLALGTAFHAALSQNFRQKIESRCDLPLDDMRTVFQKEWNAAAAEAEFRDDEDRQELAAVGEALVDKYMLEAAPDIRPQAVETPVAGEIGGVKVHGFVDLLDTEGRIIDCKSAAKRPNGVSHDYGLQLTSYAMITPGASGICRLDTVTKTKTVQLVQQTYHIGPPQRRYAEGLYPMVQLAMRQGIYLPHRGGTLCSRRWCGYWRACEREFGGTVEE